jgi:tRNA 5-methylaminomethyl-2-thiouridine biosynthesis bifunctional protein
MAEPATALLLKGCGLPQEWGQQAAWRILDTRFDRGLHFLNTWHAWRNDPLRPRLLHYVALSRAPALVADLLAGAAPFPELRVLAEELTSQWSGLLPGFHRFTLNGGQVLLTLCVGDLTPMLREQQFAADSVYLDPEPPAHGAMSMWNVWTVKALARCCRRGTTLATTASALDLRSDLTQCGFEMEMNTPDPLMGPPGGPLRGQFNPRWTVKNTRTTLIHRPAAVGTCAVIGAGLAGASVAAALARRGWQVQVLDQGDAPAAGASGLPVGLVVPHVSGDDCVLSRLSRSGVRLMLQQARSLLQRGQDWGATGTLERRVDGSPGLPDSWPAMGLDWSHVTTPEAAVPPTANAAWRQGIPNTEPAIWHSQAAWLKPAQLVRAWLAQPGITFHGNACVAALRQSGDQWELLDASGLALARANRVIFANAGGALPLLETLQTTTPALGLRLQQLPAMHGVHGQLSWAMHPGEPDAAFPPFPVNGAGSVVPAVPVTVNSQAGLAWFVGSSYQPDNKPLLPIEKNHASNLARLYKLLPALGQALGHQFATGPIHAWINTRCVTADRLPVVGPLYQADNPSLWICAGMGSRGLSFSVLCAELLAARWGAEPLPVDAALAQSLTALRGSGTPPEIR